jgi:hypothetical protein
MFWTIVTLGGLAALGLMAGGGWLLTRAQAAGTGMALPITLLILGAVGLIATVVGALLAKPEQPVGSSRHVVEVVSRSTRPRQFYLTLRNVETGQIYPNIRPRGGSTSNGRRCRNGPRNFKPGLRFESPFTIWRNSDTGVQTETPNEVALGRSYC